MITLYKFGSMFGLPDASPFGMKGEALLKMSGLSFDTRIGSVRTAPKGKLPYIEDGDVVVADTTFIRLHLERRYSIDFDAGLSRQQRGVAWAVEKMCEDHVYWALMQSRWMEDDNFNRGAVRFFDAVPRPIRGIVQTVIRRRMRRSLRGQGMGLHSTGEIYQLAQRAINSLAEILDGNQYLMGERRCGADATAFAFLASLLCAHFHSPLRMMTLQHANLVSYHERMNAELYDGAAS